MALTEQKLIDKIEIVENGILQVREATRVSRDGVEIAKTYHRWTLIPGQDVSDQPINVQAIAQSAWTPDVIAAYQAQQEANRL
jgi:hypothetical protein